MKRFLDIFDQSFFLLTDVQVFPLIDVQGMTSETICDLLHPLVFVHFPQVVRQIKHDSLEAKREGDPLVVGMANNVSSTWDGEGGCDPTVGRK